MAGQRDFEFATIHQLTIERVIEGGVLPYTGDGLIINSDILDGMNTEQARHAVIERVTSDATGASKVSYRLRDWLVSRQRYWGCPIPIVHCRDCGAVPVADAQLPVVLPEIEDYLPRGCSPLAAAEEWVQTTCPQCGGTAKRETDTLDTFVDSSRWLIFPRL